jgi:hypothetical protein
MPDPAPAIYVKLRCLHPGCQLGEPTCSVGLDLTDDERLETAEGFVTFAARGCRLRHKSGVEAVFSDQPHRRILFSKRRKMWAP